MTTNQQSLSVVLSVHNAEKTLSQQVTHLLDVLPDLAQRFELLILDDGSTDRTEEVAHELARDYPQLRVARHNKRMGADANLQTALEETTGDVVVLQDEEGTKGLHSVLEAHGRQGADRAAKATTQLAQSNFEMATEEPSRATHDPGQVGGIHMICRRRQADWVIARRADLGSGESLRPFAARRSSRV
ncbi:MAG: glycosyltransferase family 2 protein [Pirellulaceae bacterium]